MRRSKHRSGLLLTSQLLVMTGVTGQLQQSRAAQKQAKRQESAQGAMRQRQEKSRHLAMTGVTGQLQQSRAAQKQVKRQESVQGAMRQRQEKSMHLAMIIRQS